MNNITSSASCDANKNNLTFDCNKCKFIFFKWNTFNTHMKRQRFIALCRITLIGQMYWGSQTHETKAILYLSNESHLMNTYRDTELLCLGNCIEGAKHMNGMQFFCNKCNFILYIGSQTNETKAIRLQQVQYHICQIKHIQ